MPTAQEKLERNFGLFRFTAAQVAVFGWLMMSLPSEAAVPFGSENAYLTCTARLQRVTVSPEDAARACALSLDPPNLSRCVADIKRQTSIIAPEALETCRQVRLPRDLSKCVVAISRSSRGEAEPAALDYCGRSLLPSRFAECVVGLRRETDLAPVPAMDSCIDASDRLPRDLYPNFIPNDAPTIQVPQTPLTPRDLRSGSPISNVTPAPLTPPGGAAVPTTPTPIGPGGASTP
jgi:hypothetical protein